MAGGAPFVGRTAELERIGGLLDALAEGVGFSLLITGEAGIGKSALVGAMVDRAQRSGLQVRTAAAMEFERGMRLRVFHELLGADRPDLDTGLGDDIRQAPSLLGASPAIPERLLDAVMESVERLADEPFLLVAEDLHWADLWSLQAIQRLTRLTTRAPLGLVIAIRTPFADPEVAALQEVVGRTGAPHLALGPLSDRDAEQLVRTRLGDRAGTGSAALVAKAQGHPLYLSQLIMSFAADVDARDDEATPLPTSVDDAVSWRVAQISDEARQVVRWAAVLGNRFSLSELEALTGRSAHELVDPVTEAADAGVLVDDGPLIGFAHDLLREAIYRGVPQAVRQQTHCEVAQMLEQQEGGQPLRLARHRLLGSSPGDREAVETGLDAAIGVTSTDPRTALELLALAQPLATDADLRSRIDRARAQPLAWTGRIDDAIELLRTAIEETEGDERSILRWVLAGVHVLQNQPDAALADLDLAIAEADEPVVRARLTAQSAQARMAAGHTDFLEVAEQALEAAQGCGDPVAESLALSTAGRSFSLRHRYAEGIERTRLAVEVAERDPDGVAHRFTPWFFYGLCLLDADDYDGVAQTLTKGREQAQTDGSDWALTLFAGLASSLAYRQGRLDDATAEAQAGAELAEDSGTLVASVWCKAFEAQVALFRDEVDRAREVMADADRLFASGRAMLGIDHYVHVQAQLAAEDGDTARALELMAGSWDVFAEMAAACHPVLAADLTRYALAEGDFERAERTAKTMAEVADATDVGAIDAVAARCRGLVERDPEQLEGACARYAEVGRPVDAALSAVDRLDVLIMRGRAADAESELDAVTDELDRYGLLAARRRVSEMVSQVGLAAPPSPETSDPWDSLTKTELDVARLIGEGLSNADIAATRGNSVRTIESHLSRIYTKLGINRRTQLAVEVATRS